MMKLTININDEEMRKSTKEMIKSQIKSVIRTEMQKTINAEIKNKMSDGSLKEIIEEVIRTRVNWSHYELGIIVKKVAKEVIEKKVDRTIKIPEITKKQIEESIKNHLNRNFATFRVRTIKIGGEKK